MRRSGASIRSVLLWSWLAGAPPALAAQADVRAEVTASSRYAWRGINRVTGWVAQMEGSGNIRLGTGSLGLGGFAVLEPFRAGDDDLTEAGRRRRGLGEVNWWAEYRRRVYDVDLGLGVTRFTYHGEAEPGGRASGENTTELSLSVEASRTYLSPGLTAYFDIDRVKGVYLEATGALPVLGWPFPPEVFVYLDGAVGLSFGQDPVASRPTELAYYAGDGFTHAQVGLTVDFKRTALVIISGGTRLQAGLDNRARLGAGGRSRDLFATFWLGTTVGALVPAR